MNLNILSKYFIPKYVLDVGGHTGKFYPKLNLLIQYEFSKKRIY